MEFNVKKNILFLLFIFVSFSAFAQQQTVTLTLPTMNCATCPFTVKMALNRTDGVSKAEVDYKTKQAVVIFDDAKTTAENLIKVTTNAGYPSTIINK